MYENNHFNLKNAFVHFRWLTDSIFVRTDFEKMKEILLLFLYYLSPVLSSWNSASNNPGKFAFSSTIIWECAKTSNVTFDFGTLTACITSGPESEVFFQLPYALPPTGKIRLQIFLKNNGKIVWIARKVRENVLSALQLFWILWTPHIPVRKMFLKKRYWPSKAKLLKSSSLILCAKVSKILLEIVCETSFFWRS